MSNLSSLRKRRGAASKSIARLIRRLSELEAEADQSTTFDLTQDLMVTLGEQDKAFRDHHYDALDLISEEDEVALENEQKVLDRHDDVMDDANLRIKRLLATASASAESPKRKALVRQQSQLKKILASIRDTLGPLTTEVDVHPVQQYGEHLRTHKLEMKQLGEELLVLSLDDSDDLYTAQHQLGEMMFECELLVKKLFANKVTSTSATPSDVDSHGVKLPKLAAPTFDGKFTNWTSFWEQFEVAIHDRTTLSDVEKLAYLRNSLKDGSAKGIIEGLSTSGEYCTEAIATLKARYDRPRLSHQSHVRAILEAPGLKEGTGREIRKLHDTTQQNLRALKSMGLEP